MVTDPPTPATASSSPSDRRRAATAGLPALVARAGLWPVRALWLLLPLLAGPGLIDAIDGFSPAVRSTIEIGSWIAWFAGLVGVLAPSAVALTTLRILAPAIPIGVALAATIGGWSTSVVVAVLYGLLVAVAVFLPLVGDRMINGSAYGSERRMALRPTAGIVAGPLQIAWILVFAGIVTGPLLIASGRLVVGVAATVIGLPVAGRSAQALHQLARRWLVFVPAGFVIHDYQMLGESLLFQRRHRPSLGAAPTGTDAADTGVIDLSGGAAGLALLATASEPQPVVLRRGRDLDATTGSAFVFTPSLPGEVLKEARIRALRID